MFLLSSSSASFRTERGVAPRADLAPDIVLSGRFAAFGADRHARVGGRDQIGHAEHQGKEGEEPFHASGKIGVVARRVQRRARLCV